jgi:gamma-glutamyltranspeptidase/glutathione hydrolase
MLQTLRSTRGMVTSSHHLAAEAGLRCLREGGNAIEAMVAAAATISVVYPHMNGLGGDGFWLISEPDHRVPRAINAVGAAGARVDVDLYQHQGLAQIPSRGPLAANTVAGTISGWQAALEMSDAWGGSMPLARLLEDATHYAEAGFPVTDSQHHNTAAKQAELVDVPGWADTFLANGEPPAPGTLFKQPALAATLRRLADAGLDDFYRGELARNIAADLERAGCPVNAADYGQQRAVTTDPLCVRLRCGDVYNTTPPSQGLASLIILGIFDRLGCHEADGFEHVHGVVEATKRAILLRNAHVTDPAYMEIDPQSLLDDASLSALAAEIDPSRAMPWPVDPVPGDTVWLGAVDGAGRGLPFHTNNPAMALLNDGRVMVYGAMGGEGQPQSQAAVFTRYAMLGVELQHAVSAPRWVLSRTWGDARTDLRLENRFPGELVHALRNAGHEVNTVDAFDEVMGHVGAIVLHPSGLMDGATDPRSCGAVSVY